MSRYAIPFFATIYMLLAAGIPDAAAVPAYPHPITSIQSDGTRITIRIVGDEYHHYVLSEEGYTLVGGPNNDYYYARLAPNGNLEATPVLAKPTSRLTSTERAIVSSLNKGIKPTASSRLQMPVPMQQSGRMLLSSVNGLTPPERITDSRTTGDFPALILLVEFSDLAFTLPAPQPAFNALLSEDGYSNYGSTGSAWNYYQDNSNKQFNPQFRVIGPYKVSKDFSYYAGSSGADRVPELLVEACRLADAEVNFNQYSDEGTIRDLFVFYAGHNQAEGAPNTIWPHRSDVRANKIMEFLDGCQLAGYACTSEYRGRSGNSMANIGTFCHEFGHVLGWPDFYDTDYNQSGGDGLALESYSLMGSGSYNNNGRTPPALNILERWMAGWCTPEEPNESQIVELGSICNDKGLLIRTRTDNDYFLAEYRGTGKTVWDKPDYIGNVSGLMVYHVDYTAPYQKRWTINSNTVNADPSHECMKLVRSEPGTIRQPGKTFFPGQNNVKTLTPFSNADFIAWSGRNPVLHITNITLDKGIMLLDIKRIGGPELNLKVQTYQFDALLSWEDATTSSWNISWKLQSGTQELGSTTVKIPEIHIDGLQPATTYEVTISATTNAGEKWTQTHVITSAVRGSNVPHIGLLGTEYTADKPVLMSLMDYRGNFKNIEWYIDGQKSASTYLLLPSGEHTITAVITAADGSKEYLIKYITVN